MSGRKTEWQRNRLKELRFHRRISQQKVAMRLGVSQSTVSNWESGYAEPDAKEKRALASILRTTVDDLVVAAEARTA